MYLEKVNTPKDIKKLNIDELNILCEEIRAKIISTVLNNGGHLASSLGSVELIVAMHYVFDAPKDKLIFDVGHQAYAHKILTGRYNSFNTLRQKNGISGFPKDNESEYDFFNSGHSGNSIAIAEGAVYSRDLNNDDYKVVSLIGDGSFANGVSLESLNNIKEKSQLLIILNDNDLSINKSVGSISKSLFKMRLSKKYLKAKENIKKFRSVPLIGKPVFYFFKGIQKFFKFIFLGKLPFEQFGLKYIGPVDGHNLEDLISLMQEAKTSNRPILLHTKTIKGKGYKEALQNPDKYHSIAIETANNTFGNNLSRVMSSLVEKDNRVVCISSAMVSSTGLKDFSEKFPKHCIDTGIAEDYAVSLATGLAKTNVKPYVAIYSTFLQRSYDQILDEVCLSNLPVTFLIDRAGAVSYDGETHQGIFDISYLSNIPNLTIYSPRDLSSFEQCLEESLKFNNPLAIRYQKDEIKNINYQSKFEFYKWNVLEKGNSNFVILANGNNMIYLALKVREELLKNNIDVGVVDACFIKPLDLTLLDSIKDKNIISIEDNVLIGGFGSMVASTINKPILSFGHKDRFIPCMSTEEIYEYSGLTVDNISKTILSTFKK